MPTTPIWKEAELVEYTDIWVHTGTLVSANIASSSGTPELYEYLEERQVARKSDIVV
jgi:hypothetical protein